MGFQIQNVDKIMTNGAGCYDAGVGHDDHGLPPGHPAIDTWQAGWRARRDQVAQQRYDRLTKPQAVMVAP